MSSAHSPIGRRKLSVAMIVRNEADVLCGTIESVRNIADEIVVFDTGSTDGSSDVARAFGAKVVCTAWGEDFSAARNLCLRHVQGQWVLWLDAGETLDPATAAELRVFIDLQADAKKAYQIIVEVPPTAAGVSSVRAARTRLMPNRPELRFAGRVHESIQASLASAGMTVAMAPGKIARHVREHDPQRKKERARRNIELVMLEAAQTGSYSPRLLVCLGDAYADAGNMVDARQTFTQAISQAERGSIELLEAYYGLLAALDDPDMHMLRVSTCLEAIEAFPFDAQLLLAMGNYMQSCDRFDLATRAFEAAMRFGQVNRETWHLTELAEVAAACLSLCYRLEGKEDRACDILRRSLAEHPQSNRLRRQLLEIVVKLGRIDEAMQLVDQLQLPGNDRVSLRQAVRGACQAATGSWTPALGYLQTAFAIGCRDPLCLRWLAVALISNGQPEAARPVLDLWREVEPDNAEATAYLAAVDNRPSEPAPPAAPVAIEQSSGRWLRIDAGNSMTVAPAFIPVVSQTTSMDRASME